VLGYSISGDEVKVSGHLPFGTYGGFLARRSRGIYHFGGTSGHEMFHAVLRFDIPAGVTTNVGALPQADWYMAGLGNTQDTWALLFGGYTGSSMVAVDLSNLNSTVIGSFPSRGAASSAVWMDEGQQAIVVGDYNGLLQYSVATSSFSLLPYPGFTVGNHPSIVQSNGTVIMVGTSTRHPQFGSHGLIKFEPGTGEYSYVPVEGYPGSREEDQEEYCGVYTGQAVVLARNRVFIFGGYNLGCGGTHGDIWYIDL